MIGKELEARILRLFAAEKWKVGTIAAQLGVHHSTVRRVLAQAGVEEVKRPQRASMVEPFLPFVEATLERYPRLSAARLFQMVSQRGYRGGPDHFRHLVARLRPKSKAEAFHRLRTLPGEQGQVDWGHFGKLTVGRAERSLMAFVLVLSFSRKIFLRFFLDATLASFLRGHVHAFTAWNGLPRTLLYDNLRSVVLEREGDVIRFHPQFLDFATHYRFEPRPVAPARGSEKGRVERAIQYARSSFFAARRFRDLAGLNAQAEEWTRSIADCRRWPEDRTLSVGEAFEQERAHLLPQPECPHPTEERLEVSVRKTPYVRFDLNDYSVPHDRIERTLVVFASETCVRIFDRQKLVATHERSYSKGEQIEEPSHLEALTEEKRRARQHRGTNRLLASVPELEQLLQAVAERGLPLRRATAQLERLLDLFGPKELQAAVAEAQRRGSLHPQTVEHILEHTRHGAAPRLPVTLPDDPRLEDLRIEPHSLEDYDQPPSDDQEEQT